MPHACLTPGCVGQNVAGAVTMVEQIVLTTRSLGWLFTRFARHHERRQALHHLAAERVRERLTRMAREPVGSESTSTRPGGSR